MKRDAGSGLFSWEHLSTTVVPVLVVLASWAALNTGPMSIAVPGSIREFLGFRAIGPLLAGAFGLGIILAARQGENRLRWGPMGALSAYAILGFLGGWIASPEPGTATAWGALYLSIPLVMVGLWTLDDHGRAVPTILRTTWGIVGLITAVLIIQGFVLFDLWNIILNGFSTRLYGTYPEPAVPALLINANGAGRFGAVFGLVALSRAAKNESWLHRALWLVGVLLAVVLLVATESRTATVAFLGAGLVLAFLCWGKKGLAATMGTGFIGLLLLTGGDPFSLLTRERSLAGTLTHFSGRVALWETSLQAVAESPVVGRGFLADRILGTGHPHNGVVHALLQSGVVGLLFFLLAWLVTGWNLLEAGVLERFPMLSGTERVLTVEAAVVLVFLGIRSISESTGAFYGVDLLILAPVLVQIHRVSTTPDLRDHPADEVETSSAAQGAPSFPLLGQRVSAINRHEAVSTIGRWIDTGIRSYVCVASVNMLVKARDEDGLDRSMKGSGLVVPGSWPLTQVGDRRATRRVGRVWGTDLTRDVAKKAAQEGWGIYIYGGAEGVSEEMAEALKEEAPGLDVVGAYSPPFRPLTEDEKEAVVEEINEADPDIVLVGLGCPKQEKWMAEHRGSLEAPVLIGVGAAFDFIAGRKDEAPDVVQSVGGEWLWRFLTEPRRLWPRVFHDGPRFLTLLSKEAVLKPEGPGLEANPPEPVADESGSG